MSYEFLVNVEKGLLEMTEWLNESRSEAVMIKSGGKEINIEMSRTSRFWAAISLQSGEIPWTHWRVLFGETYGVVAEFVRDTGRQIDYYKFRPGTPPDKKDNLLSHSKPCSESRANHWENIFNSPVKQFWASACPRSPINAQLKEIRHREYPLMRLHYESFAKALVQVLGLQQEMEPREVGTGLWFLGTTIEYQFVKMPILLDIGKSYKDALKLCRLKFTHQRPIILSCSYPSVEEPIFGNALSKTFLEEEMAIYGLNLLPDANLTFKETWPPEDAMEILALAWSLRKTDDIVMFLKTVLPFLFVEDGEISTEEVDGDAAFVLAVDEAITVDPIRQCLIQGTTLGGLLDRKEQTAHAVRSPKYDLSNPSQLLRAWGLEGDNSNLFKLLPGGNTWLIRFNNGPPFTVVDRAGMPYIQLMLSSERPMALYDLYVTVNRESLGPQELSVLQALIGKEQTAPQEVVTKERIKEMKVLIRDIKVRLDLHSKAMKGNKEGVLLPVGMEDELKEGLNALEAELKKVTYAGGKTSSYSTSYDTVANAVREAMRLAYAAIAEAETEAIQREAGIRKPKNPEGKKLNGKKLEGKKPVTKKSDVSKKTKGTRKARTLVKDKYKEDENPLTFHLADALKTARQYVYKPSMPIKWQF